MKRLHIQGQDELPRFEASVEAKVQELFRRYPMLCGFTFQETAQLTVDCWPSEARSDSLADAIAQTLLQLIDGRPEAARRLCGRTFARVLH
jgi:hypothetical protein